MDKEQKLELIQKAIKARENAYAPYSGFKVGAALLSKDGRIFTGCNVENAAYPDGLCAERTAIFKAVSEGAREFVEIAIVGGSGEKISGITAPCGSCRQVMREFCDPEEFLILLSPDGEQFEEYTLSQLLPLSFGPNNLNDS